MTDTSQPAKVPAVTLVFWVLKILATTLGETAGDTLSMTLNLGYLAATGIFATIFAAAVAAQIAARRFHPWVYWATIIATTTVGTTLADFADRSLGIGYAGGSAAAPGAAARLARGLVPGARHRGRRIGAARRPPRSTTG